MFCWNILACWYNSGKIAKFWYILTYFLTSRITTNSEKSTIFTYFTKIKKVLFLAFMKWPKLAIFHFSLWVIFILHENSFILSVSIGKVYEKWGEMENFQHFQTFLMLKFDLQFKISQKVLIGARWTIYVSKSLITMLFGDAYYYYIKVALLLKNIVPLWIEQSSE